MKNVIWRKVVVPSIEADDCETPSVVTLTEENNCFALWEEAFNLEQTIVKNFMLGLKYSAIEQAVLHAQDPATIQRLTEHAKE